MLRQAGLPTDGPGLLRFFQQRSLTAVPEAVIVPLQYAVAVKRIRVPAAMGATRAPGTDRESMTVA